jgi:hypothetical protein
MSLGPARLEVVDGAPAAIVEFSVRHAEGTSATRVFALPAVLIQDGDAAEKEPPAGAERPSVLWWESAAGERFPAAADVLISGDATEDWRLAVRLPGDVLVGIDLEAVAEETE